MAQYRKIILSNNEIYHIYNRGINRQPIFICKREYEHAITAINYYRFADVPLSLSKALNLNIEDRLRLFETVEKTSPKLIDILSYCLMPNHIHFQLMQNLDKGISIFMSNFTNSITRFANVLNGDRKGPLFEGIFKSVHIEDTEQMVHVNRYIHINPAVSYVSKLENLEKYPWSSLPEYLGLNQNGICSKDLVLSQFRSVSEYKKFLWDQVGYARELDRIKHLTFE